ncbi:MAG: FAD-dependent oxidoreductase [Succinivibrionaceae bacterium]
MQNITTDVAIIGAGTAGISAYYASKENGAKTLLIEKGPIGTTNIRKGGIPTQILRHLANSNLSSQNTQSTFTLYGKSAEHKVEFKDILNYVRNQKRCFIENFIKDMYTIPEDDRIIGEAIFKDNHTLYIQECDTEITAKSIIIATGSIPYIPTNLKLLGDKVISSDQLFELSELPKSLAIFGTGSIGLELGQTLTKLGVKTAVFGQKTFWHFTDQKVANEALEALREKAFIVMDSQITDMSATDNGINIYYLDESYHECYISVDNILCTYGRIPNLSKLKLHTAGIINDKNGIPYVNNTTMQTNVPNIFLAGDTSSTNGNLQKAISQGKIAGKNAALYPNIENNNDITNLEIIFTDPEMAIVGMNLNSVNEDAHLGNKYIIGEAKTKNNTIAQLKNIKYGLVHVYFGVESKVLLGAELCVPNAQSLAQFIHCAILNKMTLDDLVNFTFYHPSVYELLGEACRDAQKKFKLLYKYYR